MRGRSLFILLGSFLFSSIVVGQQPTPCPSPQAPSFDVNMANVNKSAKADKSYCFKDAYDNHPVCEEFFLGTYKNDGTSAHHLFCHEVDTTLNIDLVVDLGCVEGVLIDDTLDASEDDPAASASATPSPSASATPSPSPAPSVVIFAHYPVRYVFNAKTSATTSHSGKKPRVKVEGDGKNIHVTEQK
jgi:hypothetical protein